MKEINTLPVVNDINFLLDRNNIKAQQFLCWLRQQYHVYTQKQLVTN